MISAYVDYQEMRGKPKRYIIRPIVKAENKSGDCSGVISRVSQKQQSDYFSLWKSSSRYCNPWKPRQFFLTITTYSSWLDVSEGMFCCRRGSNSNWMTTRAVEEKGKNEVVQWQCNFMISFGQLRQAGVLSNLYARIQIWKLKQSTVYFLVGEFYLSD